jgi:hypothetical protein
MFAFRQLERYQIQIQNILTIEQVGLLGYNKLLMPVRIAESLTTNFHRIEKRAI